MNLPCQIMGFQMKLTVQKQLNEQVIDETVFSGHGITDETDCLNARNRTTHELALSSCGITDETDCTKITK